MRRLLGGACLGLLLLAGTAQAAGVGTLELTPETGTSFHVRGPDSTARLTLRNTGKKPTSGRLYAASATRTDGAWSIGGAGSAGWIGLPDQQVALSPGEKKVVSFSVRGTARRTGAVVVEQPVGSVVQRAATLVYLEPAGRHRVTLPAALVVLAVVLLVAAAGGVLISRRSRA